MRINFIFHLYCYLCIAENGLITYLWIGMNVSTEWVQNVFGVQSVAQIDIDKVCAPTHLNNINSELTYALPIGLVALA